MAIVKLRNPLLSFVAVVIDAMITAAGPEIPSPPPEYTPPMKKKGRKGKRGPPFITTADMVHWTDKPSLANRMRQLTAVDTVGVIVLDTVVGDSVGMVDRTPAQWAGPWIMGLYLPTGDSVDALSRSTAQWAGPWPQRVRVWVYAETVRQYRPSALFPAWITYQRSLEINQVMITLKYNPLPPLGDSLSQGTRTAAQWAGPWDQCINLGEDVRNDARWDHWRRYTSHRTNGAGHPWGCEITDYGHPKEVWILPDTYAAPKDNG